MCDYRIVEMERGIGGSFGFSVIGGVDTELPPMVCALVHNGSAQLSGKVSVGDVLVEVNGECVSRFPTKKVVETLRQSPDTIHLRLRKDPEAASRAQSHLRRYSVQDPKLQQFQTKVRRSASLPGRARRPAVRTRSELHSKNDDAATPLPPGMSKGRMRVVGGEVSPTGIEGGADGTFRRRMSKRSGSFSRITTSFPAHVGPPCTVENSTRTANRNKTRSGANALALKRTISDNSYVTNSSTRLRDNSYVTNSPNGPLHCSSLPEIAVSDVRTEDPKSFETWHRCSSTGDSLLRSTYSKDAGDVHSTTNNNHTQKTASESNIPAPNIKVDLQSSPYPFRKSKSSLDPSPTRVQGGKAREESSTDDTTCRGADTEKTSRGVSEGNINNATSEVSCNEIARRLFFLDGYEGKDISPMLYKNNDFSKTVAVQFMMYFDFKNDSLVDSLRKLLNKFNLTGETQERERILIPFSNRYYACNKPEYGTVDAVHTLICSIMLLNTDLHGEQTMGRRMKQAEFIKNLSGLCDDKDFPVDLLKNIYTSIKSKPLELHRKNTGAESPSENGKANGKDPKSSTAVECVGSFYLKGYRTIDDDVVYKEGLLYRKLIEDTGGKKTSVWKRGWQPFLATLRGMIMFLHKPDESRSFDDTRFSLGVHHSFASPALDYRKKPAVFRFITADWKVMLFQARDKTDLLEWVEKLNLVAASFSAPSLPAPVGSSRKFQKPVLPFSRTRLTLTQQLENHEKKAQDMETVLIEQLQKQPAAFDTRQRELDEWMEKRDFFEYEYKRYRSYANILKSSKLEIQARQRTGKSPNSKRNGLLSDTMKRYSSLNDLLDAADGEQTSNTNYRESYFMAIYRG